MTRDDAIRTVNALQFGVSCGEGRWLIDALSSLGMLKLEEPKTKREKFKDCLVAKLNASNHRLYAGAHLEVMDVLAAYDESHQ